MNKKKKKYLTPLGYQLEVIKKESPDEYEKLMELLKTTKQQKVMNKEVKKCVLEILDVLYDRSGFDNWWDNLGEEYEKEITAELEQIVKRRFEKYRK